MKWLINIIKWKGKRGLQRISWIKAPENGVRPAILTTESLERIP